MFERFTDRARRVVVLAQEEAKMLNHNYIGTEHILLGLIHEGEGVAFAALTSLGVSLDDVRDQVEDIIGKGQIEPTGHIPFTPRAKRVLELSLREALQLGHNYIGTEHILLGLIREGDGVAAQVLNKLGCDLNRVRQQIIQLLSGYQGKQPLTFGDVARSALKAEASIEWDIDHDFAFEKGGSGHASINVSDAVITHIAVTILTDEGHLVMREVEMPLSQTKGAVAKKLFDKTLKKARKRIIAKAKAKAEAKSPAFTFEFAGAMVFSAAGDDTDEKTNVSTAEQAAKPAKTEVLEEATKSAPRTRRRVSQPAGQAETIVSSQPEQVPKAPTVRKPRTRTRGGTPVAKEAPAKKD